MVSLEELFGVVVLFTSPFFLLYFLFSEIVFYLALFSMTDRPSLRLSSGGASFDSDVS